MIDLIFAAALAQAQTPAQAGPCHAAAAVPGLAGCPAWRLVSRTAENATWMDPASVRRDGARVEVSVRIVFARAEGNAVRSAVMRHAYDCTRRTGATVHVALYDAAGALHDEQQVTGEDAAPVAPEEGSPDAAVLATLCPR